MSNTDNRRHSLDLSEDDVTAAWAEIVESIRAPKLRRSTSAWDELGERYRSLPFRRAD